MSDHRLQFPSAYQLKRAAVSPRTVLRRRRSRDIDRAGRSMLETLYYAPSIYRFIDATVANPRLLFEADLDEHSVVIDAGAYDGAWSDQVAQRYRCRIYAFEPSPPARAQAAEKLKDHDVILLPYALGSTDGTSAFAIAGPGSTLFEVRGSLRSVEVEVRDVVGVLDELGIDRIDLLKLNIEGGEYDVLDRLDETGWLGKTRQLSVQFHEWHPHAYRRRRQIRRRLRRTHDELWGYTWVWEFWRLRGDGSAAPR